MATSLGAERVARPVGRSPPPLPSRFAKEIVLAELFPQYTRSRAGGGWTVRGGSAVAVLPSPEVDDVTLTELFLIPLQLATTFSEIAHTWPPPRLPPDNVTVEEPRFAVSVPPQPLSGVPFVTTRPSGRVSVKP